MIDVSVPCVKCGQPIRFGVSRCAGCGTKPSPDARAALHERLAASSADYRDLQEHVSSARTVLLILAAVYVGYGTLSFFAQQTAPVLTPEDAALARAELLESLLFGLTFIACWRAARTAPLSAIVCATLIWLALQAAGAVAVSMSIFAGLWVKAVAAILLVRGIIASIQAKNFLRKLRVAAQQDVSTNG